MLSFNTKKGSEFIIVSSAATNKVVTSNDPYVGRYWFNTKTYMPQEGKLLAKTNKDESLDINKVAILTTDDEFGTTWAENFTNGAEAAGFPKATTAKFQTGTTDLYPQLTPLISSGADLIAMPLTCDQASQAVKQAKELGYKGRFMFMLACDANDLKSKLANPANMDGALFESGPWNSPNPTDATFRKQFKAMYPDKPFDPSASTTYSQASWIVEAIKEAGTTDVAKVRAAMPKALTKSANTLGLKDMQKDGETTGTVHLRLVKPDGSYQEIQ